MAEFAGDQQRISVVVLHRGKQTFPNPEINRLTDIFRKFHACEVFSGLSISVRFTVDSEMLQILYIVLNGLEKPLETIRTPFLMHALLQNLFNNV